MVTSPRIIALCAVYLRRTYVRMRISFIMRRAQTRPRSDLQPPRTTLPTRCAWPRQTAIMHVHHRRPPPARPGQLTAYQRCAGRRFCSVAVSVRWARGSDHTSNLCSVHKCSGAGLLLGLYVTVQVEKSFL